MAITKVGCMKASKKKQKDIHLKNSINYILNPMKLGMVNLAGGINCPLEIAYEQMKATKEMFQKTGGRQGYSLIISLKPGEGTPEIMYDIAMRFTDIFLKGKYEAVVAVHTDRAHLHAHIVFNSIDMTEGYKFQYHNRDWKHILQPITNQLCEEYGLEIMPAEYSEDPKNMSRPEWEREQSYSTLIKGDAFYCAILAESNQHFIFLLKSLGYDVKEGKHIAVKAPGMKRFKRIDTIDEQLSKENLDILIRYGDSKSARPKVNTFNPIYVKRAKLSQFQKKYYARMYRLRLIEKKRFNYKSAYYYESIKQMHLLQEEYLLVVNNDVNSFTDLLNLTNELQQDLKDVETEQNQMYSNHGIEKRKCKEVEDFEKFRSNEPEYKRELEALKERKGKIKDQIQIADRCYKKELSRAEEVLERMIPVGDMEDIGDIYDVDVPENPYKEAAVKVEEVIAPKQIAPVVEAVIEPMIEPKSMIIPESVIKPITEIVDVVENEAKINFEIEETLLYIPQNTAQEIRELPKTLDEYQRLSLQEKAERFPFEKYTDDKAFDYFMNYLTEIGSNIGFSEAYDEFAEISEFYDKMQEQKLVEHEIEKSMYLCDEMGMSSELFKQANADIRAMVFHLDELDYKVGIKVYRGVLEKLGIQKDLMEVYEEFDEVYKESVTDKKKDEKEWRR